jgi:hypothetical protein
MIGTNSKYEERRDRSRSVQDLALVAQILPSVSRAIRDSARYESTRLIDSAPENASSAWSDGLGPMRTSMRRGF